MAQPSVNDVHVDSILTDLSVAYMQDFDQFIATRVFPVISVDKMSDLYYVYNKNDWLRDEAQRRADATESVGSGYGTTTARYAADVWAFHKDVGDQVRANADAQINVDRDATAFVTQRMALRLEVQWASEFFATTVWGTDVTGVAAGPGGGQTVQWNQQATSDPIADIDIAKEAMLGVTGFEPNTMVIGYSVYRHLRRHPDLRDMAQRAINADVLADIFEVDNVYVGRAIKATNVEGEAETYSFVHSKSAWLGYVPDAPGLLTPASGYIFAWNGVSGSLNQPIGVSRFRMPELKADRVEAEMAFDMKVIGTDLGYFYDAIVA